MASEKFYLKPGYMTFTNLKREEKLMDRKKEISGWFTSRTQVINMLVNIPAIYWGNIDIGIQDKKMVEDKQLW